MNYIGENLRLKIFGGSHEPELGMTLRGFPAGEAVDAEAYFRSPSQYRDKFVAVDLIVTGRVVDYEAEQQNGEYTTYYVCRDESSRFTLLVRDCRKDATPTLINGDMITVYGEGGGTASFFDTNWNDHEGPVINGAFVAVIG